MICKDAIAVKAGYDTRTTRTTAERKSLSKVLYVHDQSSGHRYSSPRLPVPPKRQVIDSSVIGGVGAKTDFRRLF